MWVKDRLAPTLILSERLCVTFDLAPIFKYSLPTRIDFSSRKLPLMKNLVFSSPPDMDIFDLYEIPCLRAVFCQSVSFFNASALVKPSARTPLLLQNRVGSSPELYQAS